MPTPPLPSHLEDHLSKPNPCVIGTVKPDGTPNTVASWYLWEGGRVLVGMAADGPRARNVRADPRVSLTVLDGENWFRHVSLRGRVVSLEDDPDLAGMDRISQHYLNSPYPARERVMATASIEILGWHQFGFDDAG